jgi:hypothetical protein
MRFVPSVIALSLAACSAESSGLEPAVPLLDASGVDAARADGGPSVQDAATSQDAGAADASQPADASTTSDAGLDASTTDASTTDASTTDASTTDASTTDASTTDASTTDAGLDAARADAGADAGTTPDAASAVDASTAPDTGPSYAHTIAIDGVNDFTASETFATTTAGFALYVAWDATYLYLGASGSDVQTSAASTKWWLVYLTNAASTGSTTGVTYRTQTPALPFPAAWHLRWKTTNDYTNALSWSGSTWSDAALNFTGSVFRGAGNDFIELRVSRATLGNPSSVKLVSAFINEAPGGEATFAGAPSTTFTNGTNPSFAKAYALNLSQSPAGATIVP